MSIETDIADQIVTRLNNAAPGTFSIAFTAERAWMPEFDEAGLENLQVRVIPARTEPANAARGVIRHDVEIAVAVQRRLAQGTNADADKTEIDNLVGLAQEIREHLEQVGYATTPEARYLGIEHRPLVEPEFLMGRIFTSLIRPTYRTFLKK